MLGNDLLATITAFGVALIWLRLNDFAAQRGWLSSHLSRKLIHMGTGPLFVLCWPLFTDSAASRYLAALVPLLITAQFFLVGIGLIQDPAAVEAMSRSGDRREILRGPLFYGIVFVALTMIYWKDSPIGIIALMLMCGGDGLADVIGRRFGKSRLPWNAGKSWLGSLGMFFGGWLFSLGVLSAYLALGLFPGDLSGYLLPVTVIALAGTLVESLPLRDIDNLTVTLIALVLGHVLL
jgi:phytol kinase